MWVVEGEAFEAISAANSDQHLRFFSLLLPNLPYSYMKEDAQIQLCFQDHMNILHGSIYLPC